jgi:hypothetical protein
MKKQAEAFAPACALTMDEVFHGSVHVLQLAKSLHRRYCQDLCAKMFAELG